MIDPRKIILQPLLTEKSTQMQEDTNTVAFRVSMKANKIEIKKAVQKMFEVNVETVRTMVVRGKTKRMGRFEGKRPNWKKAFVTLKEGDTINFLETQ